MHIKIRKSYSTILTRETGFIRKEPGGRIRVALAYPNTYYVGMSNLGVHTIYKLFNDRPDTLCERVFLPTKDVERLHTNLSIPLLSLESQTLLKEFDILAFSCSFENDYLNCLKMISLAGLPLWAEQRDVTYPFVIMGGACTFFNVEPMAPFVDCFICGEGECIGNEFLDAFGAWLNSNGEKEELLFSLLKIEGVYCPGFYDYKYDKQGRIKELEIKKEAPRYIKPRIEKNINTVIPSTTIFNKDSEFGHMCLIEVTRGCPRKCQFCLLSQIYKPFRQRGLKRLLRAAGEGLSQRQKIGLVGASLTDYRYLEELCEGIIHMGGEVSLCSLRADDLSGRLLECLSKSGIHTITLAPEAGSERLRSLIGKGDITDDRIMNTIGQLIKWRMSNLKLYFMIGLPWEEEKDVKAILQLVKGIRHHASQLSKGKGSLKRITVSISCFVPKPLTPFQFYPMENLEIMERKIKYLSSGLNSLKGVVCVQDVPKWSFVQALLARGDRRIGDVLYSILLEKGNWKKALRKINLNPGYYLYRQMTKDSDVPPWILWLQ